MAATKSLYELKQEGYKKKNPNVITDADYYLRDKEQEAKKGYPNSIDMTPTVEAPKKVTAKGE
tara:strand:- start:132 stop:320 length:189 start_codon:yes stop_codon:yes gene_type:complete